MKPDIRIALLIALVLQNSLCTLLGRATRTNPKPEDLYNINHFITVSECVKFILSLLIECHNQGGLAGLFESIRTHVLQNPRDAVKGSLVPAFLYLISNTLLYVALSIFSAPVFQVLCQFKLITTAVMSVVLMKRIYSRQQWCCIFVLFAGVATVISGEHRQHSQTTSISSSNNALIEDQSSSNLLMGVTSVGISCLLSSLAGVYFELVVKANASTNTITEDFMMGESSSQTDSKRLKGTTVKVAPSLWIRNMMLALFSLMIGAIQGMMQQHDVPKSYLHGFHVWVWVQVFLLSCGGLLVAGVIKYADNVVKGLATGVSVVLSASVGVLFLGEEPTQSFVIGVMLIVSSVYLFSNQVNFSTVPQTIITGMICFTIFNLYFLHVSFPSQYESTDIMPNLKVHTHNNSIQKQHLRSPTSFVTNETIASMSLVVNDITKMMPLLNSSNDMLNQELPVRFHVVTVGAIKDCGGCLVLNLLGPAIRGYGYNVTEYGCPTIEPGENVVIIYAETARTRCPGSNKTAHVHWILAPLNVLAGTRVLRHWEPEDMVFHFGTNSQGSTKIPVPITNQLTIAKDPFPGDYTEPSVISKYKPSTKSGVSYILRKANRFHGDIRIDGKLPHEHLGINATLLKRLKPSIAANKIIMNYEYFLSYDPYTYWSLHAAMLGTISVVYPVKGLSKEEWISGLYIGGYLKSKNMTLTLPGIAYGWNDTELNYARNTIHELRPLLLQVNNWGKSETVIRLIQDSKRWILGERQNFQGAVLAKDFYDKWD